MQACYAVVVLGTSTKEAITCNLLAVAAVTVKISPDTNIKSFVSNSIVPLAPTALTLNILNTEPPLVIVTVIVSALPVSSDTNIEDTNVVINAGQVYKVVAVFVVKSNLTFLYLDVLSTLAMLYPY
tara:strand:+ start:6110 stop:6487 length:378 start_codon:yes stop_codon:yes gene_type:complete